MGRKLAANTIALHIPMIVTNDIDKTDVLLLMRYQQSKIATEVEQIARDSSSLFSQSLQDEIQELTSKFFTEEAVQTALYKENLTEAGELFAPYSGSIGARGRLGQGAQDIQSISGGLGAVNTARSGAFSLAQDVLGGAERDAAVVSGTTLRKSGGDKFGEISNSSYTRIEIGSDKLLGKLTGRKIIILVRVYAVTVSAEELSKGLLNNPDAIKQVHTGVNLVNRSSDDSVSVFDKKNKNVLSKVLTKDLLDSRVWGRLLKDRKFGSSFVISADVANELNYTGVNVTEKKTMRKLVDKFNIFDFFVISEDTVEHLDTLTFSFNTVKLSAVNGANVEKINIDLNK